jgi:ADP-L-glycero-D-manno-heptose 6-epimerase
VILVTGGAGFIGSNVVAALAARGERIVVCDSFGTAEKWRNIARHEVAEVIAPGQCLDWLSRRHDRVRGVVHLGAISATTESDIDLLAETNVRFSLALWDFCTAVDKPFIYASSAATYGDGSAGFEDDGRPEALARLKPLNAYAWSKHVVDRSIARRVAAGEPAPSQWVGLKFFNVYGPNEYHKGAQRSVLVQLHAQAKTTGKLRLFKSSRPDYADGGQLRDFVYSRDCARAVLWLLDHPKVSGLYNLGSGKARSFLDVAEALKAAVPKLKLSVEFFDMPEVLRGSYQYKTEAPMQRLKAAGYDQPFSSLEDGVKDYVANFLEKPDPYL